MNGSRIVRGREPERADKHFWPTAMVGVALERSYQRDGLPEDLDAVRVYIDSWLAQGSRLRHIDNCMNGYPALFLWETFREPRYLDLADEIVKYVLGYPRDDNDSIAYRRAAPELIFVDTLGMICPFLARYSQTVGRPELMQLSLRQIENFVKYGMDATSGLPYHAFNVRSSAKMGIVGWGRGVGWLVTGIADALIHVPKNSAEYQELSAMLEDYSHACLAWQQPSGLFSWQLQAIDGPGDSSATAMIAYAMRQGINLGVLDKGLFESAATRAAAALQGLIVTTGVDGASAECAGLGMYPQIYGVHPWSTGPTLALLAVTETAGETI